MNYLGRDPFIPPEKAPWQIGSPVQPQATDWLSASPYGEQGETPLSATESAPNPEPQHVPGRVRRVAAAVGRILTFSRFRKGRDSGVFEASSVYDYDTQTGNSDFWGADLDSAQPSSAWEPQPRGDWNDEPGSTTSPRNYDHKPERRGYGRRIKLVAAVAAIAVTAAGLGAVGWRMSKRGNAGSDSVTAVEAIPVHQGKSPERTVPSPKIKELYYKAFHRSDCGNVSKKYGDEQREYAEASAAAYADMFGDRLPTNDPNALTGLAQQALMELNEAKSKLGWHTLTAEQQQTYGELRSDLLAGDVSRRPFSDYKKLLKEYLAPLGMEPKFHWKFPKPNDMESSMDRPERGQIGIVDGQTYETSRTARAVVLGVIQHISNTPIELIGALENKKLYLGMMPGDTYGGVAVRQGMALFFPFVDTSSYIMLNALNKPVYDFDKQGNLVTTNNENMVDMGGVVDQTDGVVAHEMGHQGSTGDTTIDLCTLWKIPGYVEAAYTELNPKTFSYGMVSPLSIEQAAGGTTSSTADAVVTREYGGTSFYEDVGTLTEAALGPNPSRDLFGDSAVKPKIIMRKLGLWVGTMKDPSIRAWAMARVRVARIEAAINSMAATTDGVDPTLLPPTLAAVAQQLSASIDR